MTLGRLTDAAGNPVPAIDYRFKFVIFDANVGGNQIWPEVGWEVQYLTIGENGLWNAQVGGVIPMGLPVFADTSRWLEIAVTGSGDEEILPRVKLNSVPFAFQAATLGGATRSVLQDQFLDVAGDVMTGPLTITGPGGTTLFNPSASGDGSVVLPANAISSAEILGEPGIAANHGGDVLLPQGSGLTSDIVAVSITTPADGYIVVQARACFAPSGTTDTNFAFFQIDETASWFEINLYRQRAGLRANTSTLESYFPVFVDRVYFKPAGSYTFHLQAKANPTNGSGAVDWVGNAFITAVFYPTSYGSVTTLVSGAEAGGFEHALPVATTARPGEQAASGAQLYQVDLRELELKAARLQAEIERAKRELIEVEVARQGATARAGSDVRDRH